MFKTLFIEKHLYSHPITQNILKQFPQAQIKQLDNLQEVFGKVRKPYLQKRTNLNLFLGTKRGRLIKEAPPAYGLDGEPHYYYIHAYNCIYECQYCYLQGYFKSPDLVFFLNHEDIIKEMEKVTLSHSSEKRIWFHAGEFSDSLALSHLTQELPLYWDFFSRYPQACLELRTKSVNIKEILKLPVRKNIITSFSLSPDMQTRKFDLKTPSLKQRLKAISKLSDSGYPIGIHLDPVIYQEDFELNYQELLQLLKEVLPNNSLSYISIGVVRFTKEVYSDMQKNYPDSSILASELTKSFDGKIRYNRPMRLWILKKIQKMLHDHGYDKEKTYLCME